MATVYLPHSTMAGGLIQVDLKVNDANWKVLAVRCINNSEAAAAASIYDAGQLVAQVTAPAHETNEWNVANVQLGWQEQYWNDVDQEWQDGGLEMGTYVMQARWPA